MAANDDREQRLAAQLRANLARRKRQQRDALSPAPDDQCAIAIEASEVAAPAAS